MPEITILPMLLLQLSFSEVHVHQQRFVQAAHGHVWTKLHYKRRPGVQALLHQPLQLTREQRTLFPHPQQDVGRVQIDTLHTTFHRLIKPGPDLAHQHRHFGRIQRDAFRHEAAECKTRLSLFGQEGPVRAFPET